MDNFFGKDLIILNVDNFESWEKSMIELFKELNAWKLIKNKITLKEIEAGKNEKRIRKYIDTSLKIDYLLKISTSNEDNKLIKDNSDENIFTSWDKLIYKYQPFRKSIKKVPNENSRSDEYLKIDSKKTKSIKNNEKTNLFNFDSIVDNKLKLDYINPNLQTIYVLSKCISLLPDSSSYSSVRKLAKSKLESALKEL